MSNEFASIGEERRIEHTLNQLTTKELKTKLLSLNPKVANIANKILKSRDKRD